MFGKTFDIFKVLGIQVRADFSWIFLAVLVPWSLAKGFFPVTYPGLESQVYWGMGIVGAAGLFASLIVHEFSHCLVARRYGIRIHGIRLFLFGGVAEMEEEPGAVKADGGRPDSRARCPGCRPVRLFCSSARLGV